MPYETVPINITGPSYQDRSKPLSYQRTLDLYPEIVEQGKDQFVLKSFPGQALISTVTAGDDRGSYQMLEIAYRVVGNTLYEVSNLGVHTNRGTIPGTERCIFADDGINLFIVANGIVTQYDSSTTTVSTVTDSNISGAQSVDYINNIFIYTKPTLTVFSNVGDGSAANGLNAVGSELNPDDTVRDYVFDQTIYRFGTRSCPNWWNSGIGNPPVARIEGQTINVGLAAKHSIAHNRQFIYWLGHDLQVYRARSGQEIPISDTAMAAQIQSYDRVDDAFGYTFTLDSKEMYLLSFPSEGKTWCLVEDLDDKGWFELSGGIKDSVYNAGSILNVYKRLYVGHKSNGKWLKLDFDRYDLDGQAWRRRRILGTINGETLNSRFKGKRVQMKRMEFILESGTGLVSGQGDNPRIMVEASYDGGHTWGPKSWVRIGRQGQFIRAEWWNLQKFYNMVVRLTTSDPVALNIYSAAIDLRLAGR